MTLPDRLLPMLAAAALGSFGLTGTALAQDEEITGTWDCNFAMQQDEMSMTIEYERMFDADGSTTLDGVLHVALPSMGLDSSFSIIGGGTWRTEAMTLFETMTEMAVASTSEQPSAIETMIAQQMQLMFAQNQQEEASEIRSLTATTMEVEADGSTVSCEKAA